MNQVNKEPINITKNFSSLSGVDKAATILLILGEERIEQIFGELSEIEIVTVTRAMTLIGKVPTHLIREACETFSLKMSQGEALHGNLATVQRILSKSMSAEKMAAIMEELTTPIGKTTWEKLSSINPSSIASFLELEGEQTAAVIFSRLPPEYSAKVFEIFPQKFQTKLTTALINLKPVPKDTLTEIENILQVEFLQGEFISKLGRGTVSSDSINLLAEVFNRTNSEVTDRTLASIHEINPEHATNIQSKMFTFFDIVNLDSITTERICGSVDMNTLVTALKGEPSKLTDHIISAAGIRRGGLIKDELDTLPPKRRKDVKAAQSEILKVAKKLEAEGEITLKVESEDDRLVE